jgi:enoyl-CoA hydratase/carnithine racemase
MRFASREKAVFCQPEVAAGVLPDGGANEWLPQLIGRARALEVIVGGDDFDAATAELYGWINRSLPDAQLDDFVDRLAKRIASFVPRAQKARVRAAAVGADFELRLGHYLGNL